MKKSLFFALLVAFFSWNVSADSFEIDNIPVSAEAETTAAARTQALQKAQEEAFLKLMTLIVEPQDRQTFQMPDIPDLLNMVQDVSIRDEKTTATKYMALISVRFFDESIRQFLTQQQIPHLSELPPSYVVVPIFKSTDGREIIFEEENPLYQVFKNKIISNSLYKIKVPLGDVEDMTYFSYGDEAMLRSDAIRLLLKKYQADKILLVKMQPKESEYEIQVDVYPQADQDLLKGTFLSEKLSTGVESADRAIDNLLDYIDKKWREHKTNYFKEVRMFTLVIPVPSLTQWKEFERKLAACDFLDSYVVRSLRGEHLFVELNFKGREEELVHLLRNKNISVYPINGVLWLNPSMNVSDITGTEMLEKGYVE